MYLVFGANLYYDFHANAAAMRRKVLYGNT